jgi:hypothetical protein
MSDMAKTADGVEIPIKNLRIGEKVLAIDYNDQIIATEIISFLHYDNNSQGKIEKKTILFLFFSYF